MLTLRPHIQHHLWRKVLERADKLGETASIAEDVLHLVRQISHPLAAMKERQLVAALEEACDHRWADKAGSANHQNVHCVPLSRTGVGTSLPPQISRLPGDATRSTASEKHTWQPSARKGKTYALGIAADRPMPRA